MKKFTLIHIGIGKIGTEFSDLFARRAEYLMHTYGLEFDYHGFTSTETHQLALKAALAKAAVNTIMVDTTASDKTVPFMHDILKNGGSVIMSNKKALSGTTTQYASLIDAYPGRVYFETTVCAGLPVIGPLQKLIAAGDEITSIEGCLSGTLSFVCTALENGSSYSEAVKEAHTRGFTEPDPRDDLSGTDVARKALILARLMGKKLELSDITLEPLYSEGFKDLPVADFLEAISTEDDYYRMQFKYANDENMTLRYIATINSDGVKIELRPVLRSSALGTLVGFENKVVIRTKLYEKYPLVIQGPGGGAQVTAAGLFGDLLSIVLPTL